MFRIGVISDTHGHFDPGLKRIFDGVDHILHAGDIGLPWLVMELEYLAPVTAVMGNTDYDIDFKDTELVHLAGRKILLHHIVSLPTPEPTIRERIIRENPDIVIFGHTHRAFQETVRKTLYLNPGYAGRRKMGAQRSVAIIECEGRNTKVEFIDLDSASVLSGVQEKPASI